MSFCRRSTLDGAINSNDPIAEPYTQKNHSKKSATSDKEQHDKEAMIVEPGIMIVERADRADLQQIFI